MKSTPAVLMLALAAGTAAQQAGGAPTVQLSNGEVFGRPLPASGGVPVNEFLGIPFGHPTKRWEAPEDFTEPLPESPFNATMWGRACLQVLSDTASYGTEDCLHLNVWQPAAASSSSNNNNNNKTATDDLKPVIFFIYGGSDQFGEAEPYNMSGLAAFHDVVAVNMNYRTGPIGWMAFEADVQANKSTGNFGIMDIQSALRWVQREIKNFGGDPTRVAIHGQSSGAGLAEVTGIVAPASDGLLRAVISESGGLGAKSLNSGLQNTNLVAKDVGCDKSTPEEVKACMVALPPLTVTKLTNKGSWGPTVDGITVRSETKRCFLKSRFSASLSPGALHGTLSYCLPVPSLTSFSAIMPDSRRSQQDALRGSSDFIARSCGVWCSNPGCIPQHSHHVHGQTWQPCADEQRHLRIIRQPPIWSVMLSVVSGRGGGGLPPCWAAATQPRCAPRLQNPVLERSFA